MSGEGLEHVFTWNSDLLLFYNEKFNFTVTSKNESFIDYVPYSMLVRSDSSTNMT